MDNIATLECRRTFLLDGLPASLTAADPHLQILDRYFSETRLRLRRERHPITRTRTHRLQQIRFNEDSGCRSVCEIRLNDAEFALLDALGGREVRKNRYSHRANGLSCSVDVYLGDLSGLVMAIVSFEAVDEARSFDPPPSAFGPEITLDHALRDDELARLSRGEIALLIRQAKEAGG
jgi:CYTH domain-containing protein